MRKIFLNIVLVLIIVGCGSSEPSRTNIQTETARPIEPTEDPCGTEAIERAINQFHEILEKWEPAVDLADSTPKIELSDRIKDLQDIYAEANDIEIPICLEEAKEFFLISLDETIEGFLAFVDGKSDYHIKSRFQRANNNMYDFRKQIEAFMECGESVCD